MSEGGVKPWWQSTCGRVTLYHGDSIDVLPTLAADSAGLVLTDPPYDEATHKGARTGDAKKTKKLVTFDSLSEEQIRERFDAASRVASRWTVATMDFRHAAALEREAPAGSIFVRIGSWVKQAPMPQMTGDRPAQGWEAVAIMHKAGVRLRWNGHGKAAVWFYPTVKAAEYPTAKPLPLLREFVELFSDPGDLVLDPFCGSGTTLVAALERGRRAIGIDISEKALTIARARCEAVLGQGSLFGGAA